MARVGSAFAQAKQASRNHREHHGVRDIHDKEIQRHEDRFEFLAFMSLLMRQQVAHCLGSWAKLREKHQDTSWTSKKKYTGGCVRLAADTSSSARWRSEPNNGGYATPILTKCRKEAPRYFSHPSYANGPSAEGPVSQHVLAVGNPMDDRSKVTALFREPIPELGEQPVYASGCECVNDYRPADQGTAQARSATAVGRG